MKPLRPVSHRSSRSLENHLQSLAPEEAIPQLLKGLHHSLRQLIDEGLRRERIDLTVAHLATLVAIDADPGLAGAELARRNSVTAQTMNTILHRMERDGQLERRPHPSSPRADSWFVTARGNRQLEQAKVVGKGIWRKMLSALAEREVAQLQNLLQRCIRGLDVPAAKAGEKSQGARALRGSRKPRRANGPAGSRQPRVSDESRKMRNSRRSGKSPGETRSRSA